MHIVQIIIIIIVTIIIIITVYHQQSIDDELNEYNIDKDDGILFFFFVRTHFKKIFLFHTLYFVLRISMTQINKCIKM